MRVKIQRFKKTGLFDSKFKPIVEPEPAEVFDRSFPDDKKGEKQLERFCKFFKKDQESKSHQFLMKVEFMQEQQKISFPS